MRSSRIRIWVGERPPRRLVLARKGQKERIPAVALWSGEFDGTAVVWIHPRGRASLFQDGKLVAECHRQGFIIKKPA